MYNDTAESGVTSGDNRVLVVDDEECIVNIFSSIIKLAFSDVQVDIASNGRQAMECFRNQRHKLLLLDIHMPVMDGISLYSAIQECCDKEQTDMPDIIFCTGFAPPGRMKKILDANPDIGFLPKPVSPDDLVGAVKSRLLL